MTRPLLLLLTVFLFTDLEAQTFRWTTKSAEPTVVPRGEVPSAPAPRPYNEVYNQRQNGIAGIYNPNDANTRTAYGEIYRPGELSVSHPSFPIGTLLRITNTDNNRMITARVNDRGRECQDCLLTLSQAAATQLGINYRGRVSVERTGFSNWNPVPSAYVASQAQAYRQTQPQPQPRQYGYRPQVPVQAQTQAPRAGVVRPQPRYQPQPQPEVYRSVPNEGSYAVMTREVQPRGGGLASAPEPATYSRYPTVSTPAPAVSAPQAYYNAPPRGNYAVQLAAYTNLSNAQRRVAQLQAQGLTDVYLLSATKTDGQVINRVYTGKFASVADAQAAADAIRRQYDIAGLVTAQ